jgi:hypothetical protein
MNVRIEHRALFLPADGQGEGLRALDVCPNRPFHPFALLLWGTKSDTFVRQIRVGSQPQLSSPLGGWEFESDIDFRDFESLLVDRADRYMPAIERLSELGMFHRWDFPIVAITERIEITVEGPFEHAVFIGDVPRLGAGGAP